MGLQVMMEAQVNTAQPYHSTTAKITTKLQNNYDPESSENRTVLKSNNQRSHIQPDK